ncbi:MAG TPA: HD domain-containing phosphohydrolase [Candidatus Baltobacteraceae bacterium]|nr:HD domain-containing phosphohydrolase [Candidatus Baltobacteraceae bacterium]
MSAHEILAAQDAREERDRTLIRQAASLLAADLSLGELFERLCEMLANYTDASVAFIALQQTDGSLAIEYFHDHGIIKRTPHIRLLEGSRSHSVFKSGNTIWGNRPEQWVGPQRIPINVDRPETDDTMAAIFVPLRTGSKIIGCLSVQTTRADAYDEGKVELIEAIAHYTAVAVENQRMYRALMRTADFDTLTGLVSHSRLLRELDALIARADAALPAAAVMLNVTNFAMFNETYGYPEGDGVLRDIAGMLNEFGAEVASIGRFGGDVFMILLSGKTPSATADFVARLESRCRKLSYRGFNQSIPISIACGYAYAPNDTRSRSELLALCAHRTRLSRKQGGRPIGEDDIDAYQLHGDFTGVETIVEAMLDRDPFTRVHLFHVNAMASHWAEQNLQLNDADYRCILQASLLHDVGKLLVSDRILVKPSRLTPDEYRAIQHHARFGRNILSQYRGFEEVAEVVGQHHERWDGLGYPAGLRGGQIHPLARAVSILDAFSAMVMDRPYHRGIAEAEALAEIERCSGSQFDPYYVERFAQYRRQG